MTGWACPAHFGHGRWRNWKVIMSWVAYVEAQYSVTENTVCGSAVSASNEQKEILIVDLQPAN